MTALPEGVTVAWAPFPGSPQEAYLRASEFEVFYGGAKGGAKSESLLMGAVRQVNVSPVYKALILRATYGELQELLDRAHRYFSQLPERPAWNGDNYRWTWPNGASVAFGYCENERDTARYQGREWAHLAYDELGNQPSERVWELLLAEVRCPDPKVVRMARGSGNPGKAGHAWTKRRFVDACGKEGGVITVEHAMADGRTARFRRRFIRSRVWDNPVYARDPLYLAQLLSLPELLRKQLLDGDYDVGMGLALDELDRSVHIVRPFELPLSWTQFGSFDWGFAHPWVFGWYGVDEDGNVWKRDTVRGWRDKPWQIIEKIKERVPVEMLDYVTAGRDCWDEHKAHTNRDDTPTLAEQFQRRGIILTRANTKRIHGLNNLREFIAWRGLGPNGRPGIPALRWMATPGNLRAFDRLSEVVVDPDNPEDALKVNADPETGEGGDDDYDETRYALASRPRRALDRVGLKKVRAFARETLVYEAKRGRTFHEKDFDVEPEGSSLL